MRIPSLKVLAAAAITAVVAVTGVGCTTTDPGGDGDASAAPSGGTLRYGFLGAGAVYPSDEIGWGLYRGILQEHLAAAGIDEIEYTGIGTGPELNDALNSGTLDAVSYGDNPAIVAHAAGTPSRLIGFNSVSRESIIFTAPDGAKTLAELEGKTLGAVIGSYMHRVLTNYLQVEGISVEIVQGNDSSLVSSGAVDGLLTWAYSAEYQQLINNEGWNLVVNTAELPGYQAALVSVATEDFVAKYPGFPAAWRAAHIAIVEDIRANEDEFYAWYAELTGSTVEIAKQVFPVDQIALASDAENSTGFGLIDKAKGILLDSGSITSDFDVNEWWAE